MRKKKEIIDTLLSAIPYVNKFSESIVIIGINGSFVELENRLKKNFAEDVVLLKMMGLKPIIIHSGNKGRILELADNFGYKIEYNSKGHLKISKEIMKIEELVLSGEINREIVGLLNYYGAKSIGLSGKDSKFIQATPIDGEKFGLLGEIININENILLDLVEKDIIPVITPIATGEYGLKSFRISSAELAGRLGLKIGSKKIIFLIKEDGIMDENNNLISSLDIKKAKEMLEKSKGFIPNDYIREIIRMGMDTLNGSIEKIHIINSSIPHSILLEIFTDEGIGSEIIK